jgi:hypothetical protein
VQEALDDLRAELREDPIDFAELVIMGARAKARRLRGEGRAAREARKRLLDEVLHGTAPLDVPAAEEVKRLGLLANYDE